MKFVRTFLITLAWFSPVPVALYCFIINQWQAGIGASLLAVFGIFSVAMAKAFADRHGENAINDAATKAREDERRRILGERW